MEAITIEQLDQPADGDVRQLAELLVDAVESGAGVSFMAGLSLADAESFWRSTIGSRSPRSVLLVARDRGGIVGTVQLQAAWAPNQPHRADVAKLIVHRRARGRGIARALMQSLERHATRQRFTVLVLDTCKDGAAERLYTSLGWVRVGEIPNFALNPDGSLCDTVFFYRAV